jgi:hypothetical protein
MVGLIFIDLLLLSMTISNLLDDRFTYLACRHVFKNALANVYTLDEISVRCSKIPVSTFER